MFKKNIVEKKIKISPRLSFEMSLMVVSQWFTIEKALAEKGIANVLENE